MTAQAVPLRGIKILHTVVWAFFVSWIALVWWFAAIGRLEAAVVAIGVVLVEVAVLVFNRMRCPLTGIAAKYTSDRRANFDIYLPEWLARHNKVIFGALFLCGVMLTLIQSLRS